MNICRNFFSLTQSLRGVEVGSTSRNGTCDCNKNVAKKMFISGHVTLGKTTQRIAKKVVRTFAKCNRALTEFSTATFCTIILYPVNIFQSTGPWQFYLCSAVTS